MNWNKVSDSALISEYNNRFKLKTGDKIADAKEAALHLTTTLEERDVEQFIVIYLNTANKIIDTEILFKGTITTSNIYPREVIKKMLNNEASAVIFGHNHPSGDTKPSKDDIRITKTLTKACDAIQVKIHDHVIIGDGYTSFANEGLM